MRHVKVSVKVFRDDSSTSINLPSILIEYNGITQILTPLINYQIKMRDRSSAWHNKLVQVVGMLLDYMDAYSSTYSNAADFYDMFVEAVYSGTISVDGTDSSELYWCPKRVETANMLIRTLNNFADWLNKNLGVEHLNPWISANRYEERINWMAAVYKSRNSFLGHLNDVHSVSETARNVRYVKSRRKPYADNAGAKAFPESEILALLSEGYRYNWKSYTPDIIDRYNWRDIAITILMHYGGVRNSEVFHLWVQDVFLDPDDCDSVIVRIYHPSEGMAPKDFKDPRTGKYITDRRTYLLLKYGLLPRNEYASNDPKYAGWKDPRLDNDKEKYMQVYWFPKEMGKVFKKVWTLYLLKRNRVTIADTHPFAFVSHFHGNKGDMLNIKSQRESHNKAVEKIGIKVDKYLGTSPHGHRHSYGQRLSIALGDSDASKKTIQVAMHHKSINSQDVYTEPTIEHVTAVLNQASISLENSIENRINEWMNDYADEVR